MVGSVSACIDCSNFNYSSHLINLMEIKIVIRNWYLNNFGFHYRTKTSSLTIDTVNRCLTTSNIMACRLTVRCPPIVSILSCLIMYPCYRFFQSKQVLASLGLHIHHQFSSLPRDIQPWSHRWSGSFYAR